MDNMEKDIVAEKKLSYEDYIGFFENHPNFPDDWGYDEARIFAEYFFELGLQTRIDKELVEEAYSHIDSIKDIADRMTSGNFMHHRAAIKVSANTIAEVLKLMGLKAQKG